jgi:hypothetical protein
MLKAIDAVNSRNRQILFFDVNCQNCQITWQQTESTTGAGDFPHSKVSIDFGKETLQIST